MVLLAWSCMIVHKIPTCLKIIKTKQNKQTSHTIYVVVAKKFKVPDQPPKKPHSDDVLWQFSTKRWRSVQNLNIFQKSVKRYLSPTPTVTPTLTSTPTPTPTTTQTPTLSPQEPLGWRGPSCGIEGSVFLSTMTFKVKEKQKSLKCRLYTIRTNTRVLHGELRGWWFNASLTALGFKVREREKTLRQWLIVTS